MHTQKYLILEKFQSHQDIIVFTILGDSNLQNLTAVRYPKQIRGTSFGVSAYVCDFGESGTVLTDAQHISPGHLECPIPPARSDSEGMLIPGMTSLRIVSAVGFISNRVQFTYFTPPVLLGVFPNFGSREGGTHVLVTGSGFVDHGGISCSFDGVENPGRVLSATEVLCTSPEEVLAGPTTGEAHMVPLLVSLNGLHYGSDADIQAGELTFEYTNTPIISFISPHTGPPSGGFDFGGGIGNRTSLFLRVHGAHFRDTAELACRFGHCATKAKYISSSEVHCLIPPRSPVTGGSPIVAVTANGVDFSREGSTSVTFTYVDAPEIFGISPALGPVFGGTEMIILGNGFSNGAKSVSQASLVCRFELEVWATTTSSDVIDKPTWDVHAIVESDGVAKCISPDVTSARVTRGSYAAVWVSTDGGWSFSTSYSRFYFYPEVVVASLAPSTISASEAGHIVVSGHGFLVGEGLLLCLFGGPSNISNNNEANVLSTAAIWLSPELVECEVPPLEVAWGTSSPFEVRVTNNGVDPSVSSAKVVVYSAPYLLSLIPARGPRTGGTLVKLLVEGWGLSTGDDVDFTVACQWRGTLLTLGKVAVVDKATHVVVTCASPPYVSLLTNQESHLADDEAKVTLLIDGRNVSGAAGLPFLYYNPPEVNGASPSAAGPNETTEIIIDGSGFLLGAPEESGLGQAMCMFGDLTVAAVVGSDAELRCQAPRFSGDNVSATGQMVDLKVSLNGGADFGISSVPFFFFPAAKTSGE